MKKLILLLVTSIALNANAISGIGPENTKKSYKTLEQIQLEATLFSGLETDVDINSIEVYEIEEEVAFDFDTKLYLPEGFNALLGKNDLDWNTIELVEIEEEVELGFDTQKYLPKNFNPYKEMNCEKEEDVVVCLY